MHPFGFEVNPAARCGERNHRLSQNQRTLVNTIGLYAKNMGTFKNSTLALLRLVLKSSFTMVNCGFKTCASLAKANF
jgi:hypothetical protein